MFQGDSVPGFDFSSLPPDPPGWYPVRRPQPGESQRGVVLNSGVVGHLLHYGAGRSFPCVGKENGCRGCRERVPHWEGYFFVYDEAEQKTYIQAVPAGAVRNCWGVRQGLLVRGRKVEVNRSEEGRNGKVKLIIKDHVSHPDRYPVPPDIRDALARLWGTALENLNVEEHAAARERAPGGESDPQSHDGGPRA
jgi:hypothetical protein